MYSICKFCGATSTTNDKCSNCGAPIEKLDEGPAPYENIKISTAIEKHYEEASRRGFIIRSGRNETITTTIYIDGTKAFEVCSSSGSIGRYSVFANHQNLTIAITNLSKRKSVLLPGKTVCFGDDKNGLVATISELLAEMGPNLSDDRIRIESYVTNNLRVIPISTMLTVITTVIWDAAFDWYRDYELHSAAIFFASFYILFAPLHMQKNERHYKLELITKIICVLTMGVISLVLMTNPDYYFYDYHVGRCFISAVPFILTCFLVVLVYSFIQIFIILRKREYKYYSMLLTPIISITIIIMLGTEVYVDLGDIESCFDSKEYLLLMGLMYIQTIMLSIVNKHRERID